MNYVTIILTYQVQIGDSSAESCSAPDRPQQLSELPGVSATNSRVQIHNLKSPHSIWPITSQFLDLSLGLLHHGRVPLTAFLHYAVISRYSFHFRVLRKPN